MLRRTCSIALALSVIAGTRIAAQKPAWVDSLLAAADLPVVAADLRDHGVPSGDIQRAFDAMRGKRMPASEAHDVMDEERKAVNERGPVDNFGAFVQSKLDAGLRGRALASAIRAEHAARGKGRGNMGTAGSAGNAGNAANRGNAGKAGGPPPNRGRGAADTSSPQAGQGQKSPGAPAAKAPATKGRPANPGRPNKPNL